MRDYDRLRASHNQLLSLVRVLMVNDPHDMAADGVTVLDVWRKTARIAIATAKAIEGDNNA